MELLNGVMHWSSSSINSEEELIAFGSNDGTGYVLNKYTGEGDLLTIQEPYYLIQK